MTTGHTCVGVGSRKWQGLRPGFMVAGTISAHGLKPAYEFGVIVVCIATPPRKMSKKEEKLKNKKQEEAALP